MADNQREGQPQGNHSPEVPVADARVIDLSDRLACRRAYDAAVAGGPVRWVPRAFLDALQGSWGELDAVEPPVLDGERVSTG